MKIKNSVLYTQQTIEALRMLLDKDLDIKLSWKLRNFFKVVEEKAELFNQEKNKIIKKYGEENKNGQTVLKPSNKKGMEALSDLLEIEEEYPDIKINVKELEDIKMKPRDLLLLDFLIKE